MDHPQTIFKHPAALFLLFFTEMWERFSYYGMRALLVLFLISDKNIGGWAWTRSDALKLYAVYTGLVYLTPILGGFLADKVLGKRPAIILGAILMTLGHGALALETPMTFYIGLGLLISGNGFFKPNISSIVGDLYQTHPEKKDSAYTIFYMGINAGAFLGILFCGYIGENISWSFGFGLAGVFMFLGMLMFLFAQKILGKIGLKPEKHPKNSQAQHDSAPHIVRDRLIVIGIFGLLVIFFFLAFEQAGGSMAIFAKDYTQRILTGGTATLFIIVNTLIVIIPLGLLTYVVAKLVAILAKKYKLAGISMALCFIITWSIAIWMLNRDLQMKTYEVQSNSAKKTELISIRTLENHKIGDELRVLLVNKQNKTYRSIAKEDTEKYSTALATKVIRQKTGEIEVPASWFALLNSFFILMFSTLISKIWESKYNLSAAHKFGAGLILIGLGFGALAYGGRDIAQGAQAASVSMWWLIIAYWFHTMGELLISPVGLSYVSKLAPEKLLGLMFGVWFLASSIANFIAGMLGSYIDYVVDHYSISVFFLIFTAIPIFVGLIAFALNGLINRKMHGIK